MARQILGGKQKSEVNSLSSVKPKSASALTKSQLEKILRQKRSPTYMEALHKLDAGGHVCGTDALNELLEVIKTELDDVVVTELLHGIVSKCYLGHPYEVHTIQTLGDILHHYKVGEAMPAALEKARAMAKHPSYEFIEVYSKYLVAVASNGSTALVNLEGEDSNG